MAEFLDIMALPLVACLLLTGIHVYLGLHVIARRVIFVDLALAQVAALGAVLGLWMGYQLETDAWAIRACSLGCALGGAVVIASLRAPIERVPQEALIGIVYVVTLAITVLVSARLPHGSDELRHLLAGSLLWVDGRTLVGTAAVYAGVAVVLVGCRRPLGRLSFQVAHGLSKRAAWGWDFVFYACFAVVVTSSVGIAGVLVVFAFLVIPAIIAMLAAQRLGARLIIGWTTGAVVSALALGMSYGFDLPEGPVLVVTFGVVLLGVGLTLRLVRGVSA